MTASPPRGGRRSPGRRPKDGRGGVSRFLPILLFLAVACTPTTARPSTPAEGASTPQDRPKQTLVTAVRTEPQSLAVRPLTAAGGNTSFVTRVFNAELDMLDGQDRPLPYLAEALPQLNTDSWVVLPDGRMETTYRLRPNLTWHDGTALTTDDFAFALEVFKRPELGVASTEPMRLMDEIVAPDPRTVTIRWRALYPAAGVLSAIGSLGNGGFQALPGRILGDSLRQDAPDAFANHPFWANQYVGLGPFKLERWEPGDFVEGSAFDGHVLGRPKISRIIVRFMRDENTVLANILTETIHLATDRSIRFEHTQSMRREWDTNHRGVTLLTLSNLRYILMQNRPESVAPRSMLEVPVRKAIALTVDKSLLNDAVFDGQATISETLLAPDIPYFADVDRAITKYPYDPRRAEQLMNSSGLTKDRDGVFATAAGERFSPVFWGESGGQNEREVNVFVDTWRRNGLDMQPFILNTVQFGDAQFRSTYPAMYTTQGGASTEDRLNFLSTTTIPTAANRWQGNNRGAWANAEYDRLWEAFNRTLDRTERNRQVVDMLRIASEEVPVIPYYFNFAPTAHLASLKGPEMGARVPDPRIYWNIHEWSWAS